AAQVGGLLAREMEREGAVGRLEDMVALVEDEPRRQASVVEPAERRLDHHERVVGDDDAGAARLAHAPLDEAAPVMRAARMDALAAPVGEAERTAAPQQVD